MQRETLIHSVFFSSELKHTRTTLKMCMGMATIGTPWDPWDSHGNGSDRDYIMGIGMGVGIKVWKWQ